MALTIRKLDQIKPEIEKLRKKHPYIRTDTAAIEHMVTRYFDQERLIGILKSSNYELSSHFDNLKNALLPFLPNQLDDRP